MKRVHVHINEVEWQRFSNEKWGSIRWKELLNRSQSGSGEFVFGLAELPPGEKLPLHTHRQAETDYILSGNGKIGRGIQSVELGPNSALYFPGKTPHSIETLSSEPLRYIYCYACEKLGQNIKYELDNENREDKVLVRNWNNASSRWAIREEIGEWIWIEASKGFKVRGRMLFDHEHGDAQEMLVGTAEIDPGVHYTLHHHEQPETYFVLSGQGVIYVADSAIKVSPGSAVYVGKRVVHGADCTGEKPLRLHFIYGTETTGQWGPGEGDTWTPVEDIYTEIRY